MSLFLTFIVAMSVSMMTTVVVTTQATWSKAHATFYGAQDGSDTTQGACGYRNGYGVDTAALSTALFHRGSLCGACFELQCIDDPQWCISGASVTVTATNFCPPDSSKPNDDGGWCNLPLQHFDLSQPAFMKIVNAAKAGIVPVQYRRVPCVRTGGIQFGLTGNSYWLLVLVSNVAGVGDVIAVSVKGSRTGWIAMTRNWGENWQASQSFIGQSLSFRVMSSDRKMIESDNVAPKDWKFGETYKGRQF